MPSLPDGTIDVGAAEIDGDVGVVCTTMIGTHCGNVNPIAEVGAIAATVGVPMFLDACQALGQLRLDVRRLGCHLLTATGRKFLAPRGTGMLWVDARSSSASAHRASTGPAWRGRPVVVWT